MSSSALPDGCDPRAPVIVGVGQLSQRVDRGDATLEPVDLMAEAARRAAADSGAGAVLEAADSVRVINLLSWRYRDPGALLAQRLGATPRETTYTVIGGNYPLTVLNDTATAIARGEIDVALVAGGESWRSRSASRKSGEVLDWTSQEDGVSPSHLFGEHDPDLLHPAEMARQIFLPTQVYPMFDVALRARDGLSIDAHRDRIATLWAQASEVAERNPHAWIQRRFSPAEIREPSATNRMISFPYTKLLCSNNAVEQSAATIICSAERALALGVPTDRWVFVHAGADAHDHWTVSIRANLHSSPAMRLAGGAALDLAGVGPDDLAHLDIYSCFPSAVQIAADELGLTLGADRPFTVTGGMSFAGGPWNNYPLHGVAAMTGTLREDAGSTGLCTANGGYTTKHSFAVLSTRPPAAGTYRHAHPQAAVDALPSREVDEHPEGAATVESYTVAHDREGNPERAFFALLRPDGRRAWATSGDASTMAELESVECVGRPVSVSPDGTTSL